MSALDLFAAAGTPDWIHISRAHPQLGHQEEFRIREIQHPRRHIVVERCIQGHWEPVRAHHRVCEIAQLAGLEP